MSIISVSRLPSNKTHATTAVAPAGRFRKTMSLNSDWYFKRCDHSSDDIRPTRFDELAEPVTDDHANGDGELRAVGGWEAVSIPHTVRLEPLNASGGRNFQGVCWYARAIDLDASNAGQAIYLHFEGAMQVCDVWLNDKKLVSHAGGYTPFVLDISEEINLGTDNLLVCRLDNTDRPDVPPGKPQAELDFTYFGGLYRNVWLNSVPPVHVSDPIHADRVGGGGLFVTYPEVAARSATIQIRADLRNASDVERRVTIRHELVGPDESIVGLVVDELIVPSKQFAECVSSLVVDQPALWHPDHPDLHTLRTTVVDDTDGEASTDVVTLRIGIRRIEFSADHGLSINGKKFVAAGANRHQDHPYLGYAMSDASQWRDAQKLFDAGFRSVRSHYPQSNAFMDACDALGLLTIVSNPGWQFLGDATFRERVIQNARLMVRRDRNRPSVVLWEAALNESKNASIGEALQQAVHEEFSGDQCFTGGDHEPGFTWNGGKGWDVEYWHNDGRKPYWIREWGDRVDNWSDQQSANRVARGWGESAMLVQAQSHLRQMDEMLQSHHGTSSGINGSRLAGTCLWAAIDSQRGYHHQPFFGGVMDAMRLPKFSYYFFQSQRDPSRGPVVFIANFATFQSPTAVTIFSNCEKVRLTLGGREIGVQTPDIGHRAAHPPFTFQVDRFSHEQSTMYMAVNGDATTMQGPAELRAEGIIDNSVVTSHIVRPPGRPRQLILKVDTVGHDLVADGADFVRVHAHVCDVRGTICPVADDWIEFTASGHGRIVESAHSRANPLRAEGGIATALVQAARTAGSVRVRATAFGLSTAEVEIISVRGDSSYVLQS